MMLRIEFSPEALRDIEETKSRLLDEFGEKTAENIKKVMKIVRIMDARRDFINILFNDNN